MRWLKIKDIPKEFYLNGKTWKIILCKKIPGAPDDENNPWVGYCDEEDREIFLVSGRGRKETTLTLIHELIHAISFEFNVEIKHSTIYDLEYPIANLILGNLYSL